MNKDNRASSRPLRLIHAAGPGDVITTYRHWKQGYDDPSQVTMTYSGMFYDVCHDIGAKAWVISRHSRKEDIHDGDFRIEHRPIHYPNGPTIPYLLEQFFWGVRFVISAILFRADAAIISMPSFNPVPLRVLSWFGVKVIPSVHCLLWSQRGHPVGLRWKRLKVEDGHLYSKTSSIILSASADITRQINEVCEAQSTKIMEFLPLYRRETFAGVIDPPLERRPFRVLFVGRVEVNKGVFDLLQIALRFAAEFPGDFEFDLCGTGSVLEELRHQADAAGLGTAFRCHGHCDRPTMYKMFSQCHVVIVPTTTDFIEGFNQVVAEGVLARRPVITSSVCPALNYVREAVLEVEPNNVAAYADAIVRLRSDLELYENMRRSGEILGEQFYDSNRGWAHTLVTAIRTTFPNSVPNKLE